VMRLQNGVWTRTEPDTAGDVGRFASLVVSPNGTLGVAYADTTNGDVKYAQWSGSAWTTEQVDDLRGTAWTSLAFNSANQPAVSYYDAYPGDLKYATKASGTWQASAVAKKGAVGQYTNLFFDKNNAANIVYYSRKSDGVFRVWGSPASWSAQVLHYGGGTDVAAAVSPDGSKATAAWWYPVKNKLWTSDIII